MRNMFEKMLSINFGKNTNPPPPPLLPNSVDGRTPTKAEREISVLDQYYYWMNQVLIYQIKCPDFIIEDEGGDADWTKLILIFQSVASNFEFTEQESVTTEGTNNGEKVYLLKAKTKHSEVDENNTFGNYFLGLDRVTRLNSFLDKYNIYLKLMTVVAFVIFYTALSENIPPYWCLMTLIFIPATLASVHSNNIAIVKQLIGNFNFWYCQLQNIILTISGIMLVKEREGSGFLIFGFIMAMLPQSAIYLSDGGHPRYIYILCYNTIVIYIFFLHLKYTNYFL